MHNTKTMKYHFNFTFKLISFLNAYKIKMFAISCKAGAILKNYTKINYFYCNGII